MNLFILGRTEYLVKWVGWSLNDSTWEPEANLTTVNYMVKEFNKKLQIESKLTDNHRTTSSHNGKNLSKKIESNIS